GQSELDIAQATDSVVVVLMPGAGDSIQLMKAGLMEIADIFVVNKSDRPEADQLHDAVVQMLAHRHTPPPWTPPVLLTAASLDRGIETVYDRLWDHRRYLERDRRLAARRQAQLRTELRRRVEDEILRHLWRNTAAEKTLDLLVAETEKHRVHPQKQARRMAAHYLGGEKE
ncbi:MAG: hypothetical protein MUP74_03845, partial [Desulfobacterales bacterium]|nr:hypothetical protein [Desulfobacterales bacterium]